MAKTKTTDAPSSPPASEAGGEYTVVARRYRPQQFADLIGQEHVSKALVNALQAGRVAHAYLFTGARGVGKTSAARILAKALNCVEGPTATPCDRCDSCLAIAVGEDTDVPEIDGASNNGVDSIRDLRQNVGFRPTRSRYKIYIIDEVHMLSTPAFNALLKTLEEPPPHVKFIFATTEVQKIPITILSRCQRYDFAHVGPGRIFDQLKSIVEREGLQADEAALRIVARRANGSMRDSQSLLDQLLASCPTRLTAESVHAVLGTAGDERVAEIATAILAHDATKGLNLVQEAIERGFQLEDLTDQLIEYWRALMLVGCGGPAVEDFHATPTQKERIVQQAKSTSLDTILSGLDVLTTTKARMRGSAHLQVLLEMAVIRLSRLEDMLSVAQLLQSGGTRGDASPAPRPSFTAASQAPRPSTASPAVGEVKKNQPANHNPLGVSGVSEAAHAHIVPLSTESLPLIWERLIRHMKDQSPVLANQLVLANLPAIFGPNSLAVRFPTSYSHAYDFCANERSVEKIRESLREITGQAIVVRVDRVAEAANPTAESRAEAPPPPVSVADRRKNLMGQPFFKRAGDVLGAQLWHADEGFDLTAAPAAPLALPDVSTDPDEV